MLKKIIFFLIILSFLPLYAEDLKSLTIEEKEWQQEWERVLVLQGLDAESLDQDQLLQFQASVKEGMILRKIMMMLAEEKDLVPSDLEIEQRYEELRSQVPEQEQWDRLLEEQFYTEESFRDYLKESESIDSLLEQEVLKNLIVTDQESRDYYDNHPDEFYNQGEKLEFETVEESLTAFLMEQKAQAAISKYMDKLRSSIVE